MLYGDGQISGNNRKKGKKQNFKPSDGYIEKYDFKGQPTVVVRDFDPQVFKHLLEYAHTGSVILQARTLLGLMNAADHYGLDELKLACIKFMERCVNTDTVCSLLSSAEKYIQYKSTKILVQKMFEFVDQHAEAILALGAFSFLPQHVVRIVLGRDELQATETSKFEAAMRWCARYCEERPDMTVKQVFEPFVDVIDFYQIPAKHLMKRVKPADVVDNAVILNALAYQADPTSVEHVRLKPRRPHTGSSPSPPMTTSKKHDGSPMFRRVQSSGQPLTKPTADRTRCGSVPPLDPAEEKCLLRGEVHPLRIHTTHSGSLMSISSSGSLKSPSVDSYPDSVSSLEPVADGDGTVCDSGEGGDLPTPRKVPYNALDTIVSLSNNKTIEV